MQAKSDFVISIRHHLTENDSLENRSRLVLFFDMCACTAHEFTYNAPNPRL